MANSLDINLMTTFEKRCSEEPLNYGHRWHLPFSFDTHSKLLTTPLVPIVKCFHRTDLIKNLLIEMILSGFYYKDWGNEDNFTIIDDRMIVVDIHVGMSIPYDCDDAWLGTFIIAGFLLYHTPLIKSAWLQKIRIVEVSQNYDYLTRLQLLGFPKLLPLFKTKDHQSLVKWLS